ncbi:MAG: 23S rRNA (adenine(2503)-C(2))-methyltransferase RlmN [Patescibacteria group bacterium]|jgi:23S rRNA (adenine2503-C2)-methyltransferase|nr:23S rRNA (adenine(2503)-C(2))-methyltransferase RlmN [bacterium]HQC49524.1 23S rRNA (adenine(2503)-C(2))-methyltransferase RlmN [bacterium]
MNLSKLSAVLAKEPKYRYKQINDFLYKDYISNWDEASSLPKLLREKLKATCPLEIKAKVFKSHSEIGSSKALLYLADNLAVETVLIKQQTSKQDQEKKFQGKRKSSVQNYRYTICVSSQVGCPLGCLFCATGNYGFKRNLKAEEIIEQVIFWQRFLRQTGKRETVDNLVFMGMGEPFLNYQEFIKAVKFINNPETINFGARRISVSTAGIIEGIKRLSGEKIQINLAISLHAASDNLRTKLMPVAKKYPLKDLLAAVDNYIAKTGRQVMFEYLMISGVNDSDRDAENLAILMKRPLYMVNLIPYNETGRFTASSREAIRQFQAVLNKHGVKSTIRHSFGADILAACGQLHGGRVVSG